jgi:hypothetical protein
MNKTPPVWILWDKFIGSRPTPELTGRAFNETSIQVLRMKAALFALRPNELSGGGLVS